MRVSLKDEVDANSGLPKALEAALDFKKKRANEVGVDEDELREFGLFVCSCVEKVFW